MPNVDERLRSWLIHQESPADSSRAIRAENHIISKMGDNRENGQVSQSPETADENKVKLTNTSGVDVSSLTTQKIYKRQNKTSEADIIQNDSIPFLSWIESLDANPTKKPWETEFNKKVTPALEEMEMMIQSSIDVMTKFNQEKGQLLASPSPQQLLN